MVAERLGEPPVHALADIGRCRVLGVLNVTPDSFSDGGAWYDTERAVEHGLVLSAAGADIVDVGGESTRPGAGRVTEAEELRRVLPVVAGLAAAGVPVSIDTLRAPVAAAALDAGATMVNDVSGGLADDRIPRLVAEAGVPYVVMHWRGHSADMQSRAEYGDAVAEVAAELQARLDAVLAVGVDIGQVILDPGIGFAKNAEHNWALLAGLPELLAIGRPVLAGASRKAFLGQLLGAGPDAPRPVERREAATTALTALAAQAGAWGVRVHDVGPSADAVRVVAAMAAARAAGVVRQAQDIAHSAPTTDPAPDTLTLRGLRVRGRHGVLPVEQQTGQDFVVDAVLCLDTRPGAASDELSATVDYAELADGLAAVVAGPPVDLLETLAGRLAEVCLADPRVRAAEVTVHKPEAPIGLPFDDVSVTVRRGRT